MPTRSRLAALVNDPASPECIHLGALSGLADHEATEAIRELLPRLRERPRVTWAFHIDLLEAAAEFSLPLPGISHLWAVDNLDMQVALAKYAAK